MNPSRILSALAAASLLVSAAPAFAENDDDSSSSSSSSSSASSSSESSDAKTTLRIERCKRFSNGDDYERCVRLIRRLPAKENVETVDTENQDSDQWKWVNFLNKIEGKVKATVKYVSTMAKSFCKDRTAENDTTSRECMTRVKNELKTRIDAILDEVFRADLPSAR